MAAGGVSSASTLVPPDRIAPLTYRPAATRLYRFGSRVGLLKDAEGKYQVENGRLPSLGKLRINEQILGILARKRQLAKRIEDARDLPNPMSILVETSDYEDKMQWDTVQRFFAVILRSPADIKMIISSAARSPGCLMLQLPHRKARDGHVYLKLTVAGPASPESSHMDDIDEEAQACVKVSATTDILRLDPKKELSWIETSREPTLRYIWPRWGNWLSSTVLYDKKVTPCKRAEMFLDGMHKGLTEGIRYSTPPDTHYSRISQPVDWHVPASNAIGHASISIGDYVQDSLEYNVPVPASTPITSMQLLTGKLDGSAVLDLGYDAAGHRDHLFVTARQSATPSAPNHLYAVTYDSSYTLHKRAEVLQFNSSMFPLSRQPFAAYRMCPHPTHVDLLGMFRLIRWLTLARPATTRQQSIDQVDTVFTATFYSMAVPSLRRFIDTSIHAPWKGTVLEQFMDWTRG